jgi:hypothetical protein
MPKERPILFKTEMVKAILEGKKTQTRRVVKSQPKAVGKFIENGIYTYGNHGDEPDDFVTCPYGQPGDRLWVRETWAAIGSAAEMKISEMNSTWWDMIVYRADANTPVYHDWKPSIFMPRWASRITLEITEVRVERLQDITEQDAICEGAIAWAGPGSAIEDYQMIWNKINHKTYPWHSNPWVWVISFKRLP